jgi:glycosyltransferase involved in cell wall biosynthesis
MKVSVITATYNAESTIEDCLRSVAGQTHPDIEHLIIDGASKDRTMAIVEANAPRVGSITSEPDRGIYDALNKGLRRATGDIVGFLHADDLYASPDTLARIAAAFEDPRVDAVYGDLTYVRRDDVGKVIRYWKAGRLAAGHLRRGWMPPHPTFYARRSVYERYGEFDTRYAIAADYDSLVRFLFVGKIRVAYLEQVLVRMRVGGVSNRSMRTIARKSAEDLRIVRAHSLGGIPLLLMKNLRKLGQFWTR